MKFRICYRRADGKGSVEGMPHENIKVVVSQAKRVFGKDKSIKMMWVLDENNNIISDEHLWTRT